MGRITTSREKRPLCIYAFLVGSACNKISTRPVRYRKLGHEYCFPRGGPSYFQKATRGGGGRFSLESEGEK